ncbi:MAG TPA: N-acetyl-gamma-glutamyl-phosphate reductase [Candidatus Thermoplasmatota archaeon]|nr:N-acetyl-gamma-glutamyl-phosphate reductase [Candidatus Thermoplasmatota archaeon]
MQNVQVGIAGATGYLGAEAVRFLVHHPQVELRLLASTSAAGKPYSKVNPEFQGVVDQPLDALAPETLARCDVVLLATPHGVAADLVPRIFALDPAVKVIDLSGDHRLRDPLEAKRVYGHAPAALDEAVYGLPELNRDAIRRARLVANPGCYPTASALAALPLVKAGIVRTDRVVVDAKSGVSGAGRDPGALYHFPEANENIRAYKVGEHRHEPEIAQTFSVAAGRAVRVTFTPHLVPMNRGILATVYMEPEGALLPTAEVSDLYRKAYASEPFVRVVEDPNVLAVRGTNYCDVRCVPVRSGLYVAVSAIDNLAKGGSAQAVQNLNLMCGFPETMGLPRVGGGP